MRIKLKRKKPIENRPSIDRDPSNFSYSEEFAFLLNLFIGLVLGNEKTTFRITVSAPCCYCSCNICTNRFKGWIGPKAKGAANELHCRLPASILAKLGRCLSPSLGPLSLSASLWPSLSAILAAKRASAFSSPF